MTKLNLHYRLEHPLTDGDLQAIANVHSWYGIFSVRPTSDMQGVDVQYDATRMNPREVEAVLQRFGVPIVREWAV